MQRADAEAVYQALEPSRPMLASRALESLFVFLPSLRWTPVQLQLEVAAGLIRAARAFTWALAAAGFILIEEHGDALNEQLPVSRNEWKHLSMEPQADVFALCVTVLGT